MLVKLCGTQDCWFMPDAGMVPVDCPMMLSSFVALMVCWLHALWWMYAGVISGRRTSVDYWFVDG